MHVRFLRLEQVHRFSIDYKGNKVKEIIIVDYKRKKAKEIILKTRFWNDMFYTLNVTSSIVKNLGLVDGDKRHIMSYIYETMSIVKDAISSAVGGDEIRYKQIFHIIDDRWRCQL